MTARPWRLRATLAALGAGVAILIGSFGLLPAGALGSAPSMTLRATEAPAGHSGVDLLAVVSSPDGSALAGVTVSFAIHLREFSGSPTLVVGTAVTDTAGDATITYQPLWAGQQSFVATAHDASGATLATSAASVVAQRTDPFAGSVQSTRPDGLIGRWTIVALLVLVCSMWIALVGVVVRVRRGMGAPAR
jgi:hypothetical protein